MWTKPYGIKEGFLIGGGLIVAGVMLELGVGPVDWNAFRWPVNGIVLAGFLALIASIFMLRKRVYGFQFIGTYKAAHGLPISSMCITGKYPITGLVSPCGSCSFHLYSCRCVGGASNTCPQPKAPASMSIACRRNGKNPPYRWWYGGIILISPLQILCSSTCLIANGA